MHAIKGEDQAAAAASTKWGQPLHNCKVAIKRNQMIINFVRNRLKIGFRCNWCDDDKFNVGLGRWEFQSDYPVKF